VTTKPARAPDEANAPGSPASSSAPADETHARPEEACAPKVTTAPLPPVRSASETAGGDGTRAPAAGGEAARVVKSGAPDKVKAFHEEGAMGKAYDTRLLARLWPFVRPHSRFLVLSLGALAVITGVNLLRPIVMGRVAEHASESRADLLLRDGILLGALLVVVQSLTFAQTYSMQIAGARAMADLRRAIFEFLQRLRLRYFDRTPVGRLVTRATNDVDALGELFASGVLNAVGDLAALLGIVVLMLALDWRMSLIAFSALPVVGLLVNFIRKRSREAFRDIRAKTARLNVFLNEQVSGIAVVQAFAREATMAKDFDEINRAYRDANKRAIFYEAVLDAAIEMVSTVCIALVLWWAGVDRLGHALGSREVTFALVVTFTQYIKQAFEPISMLSQRYTMLQSAMAGAERIFQLLDEKDLEPDAPGAAPGAPRDGASQASGAESAATRDRDALELETVSFEYKPNVPILKDVSLRARRGEKIALVGATGAGKSTVASLFLRLYEASAGVVRVLGKDVRSYPVRELRKLFAVVPQDVFLFPGTVASNVAAGEAAPDLARVRRALERIGALDLFERRESGLEARVDERGSNFSAGERQLIAFARALYKDAPILVLDEATASVDSDTEARLQRALDAAMEGRTALVIAHRLSTIRAADRIVVFHKGRVVEQGSHDELLTKDGIYARLHRMQFAHERTEQVVATAE
jgi:ATP-binding cassette subfamily B protein